MAQSLKCSHCSAVLKPKDPIAVGKKVKCPKCQKAFVVEADEEPEDEAEDEENSSADEGGGGDDEDEDEEKPKMKDKAAAKTKKKKGKGDDEKPQKKSKTGLLIGIIGGVLLLCCLSCGGVGWAFQAGLKKLVGMGDDFAKNLEKDLKAIDKKDKGGKPAELKPEIKISAEELAKEFVKDEKAGESKYKGKVFEISGEVFDVGPTLDQVMLKGAKKDPKDFVQFGVRLGIPPEQQAQAARFSKGQKIKAVGRYFSFFPGGWVTITDCTITELEKSKTVAMTAEDLAKEFDRDAAAAEAKFKGPHMIITGVVENIRTEKDGGKVAVLKGAGKIRIVATVGAFGAPEVAQGHTLEIRANMEFPQVRNGELQVISSLIISSK